MGSTPSCARRRQPPRQLDVSQIPAPETQPTAEQISAGLMLHPSTYIARRSESFRSRYKRRRKLGSGAFGEVWLCTDRVTGVDRAVKIIKQSRLAPECHKFLRTEVEGLKKLDHPNLIKIIEFFEGSDTLYLVTELYTGGELFERIVTRQAFYESDAAAIMKQILSAVAYLHKNKIVHRDLKPENILLESNAPDSLIKVVDFGLCGDLSQTSSMSERAGTAFYAAPEVLSGSYDEKCDVWSCGVILYFLICGYLPFTGKDESHILRRASRGKLTFALADWANISEDCKTLIKQMLTVDPRLRCSALEAVQSRWITIYAYRKANLPTDHLAGAIKNIGRLQGQKRLAQAAILFIASKVATEKEREELTQVFLKLDRNCDGHLSRDELLKGFRYLAATRRGSIAETLGDDDPAAETIVDTILESCDLDRNGQVEYSEFISLCMDKALLLSEAKLKAAFSALDRDGSGKISRGELEALYGHSGMTAAAFEDALREFDKSGDGQIDFDEFTTMMTRVCNQTPSTSNLSPGQSAGPTISATQSAAAPSNAAPPPSGMEPGTPIGSAVAA